MKKLLLSPFRFQRLKKLIHFEYFFSFLIFLLLFFILYVDEAPYSLSIDWGVHTSSHFDPIVVHSFQKGLFEFHILGSKITLFETFFGSPLTPLNALLLTSFLLIWVGIAVVFVSCSFGKNGVFLVVSGLFIIWMAFIRFDNFFAVHPAFNFVPIVALVGTGYFFLQYKKPITFGFRLVVILFAIGCASIPIWSDPVPFVHYFFGHAFVGIFIIIVFFLVLISEALFIYLLYILSKTKGAKNNEKNWLGLGCFYLFNLIVYYLNQYGYLDFGYLFLNPTWILGITCLISLWSLRSKGQIFENGLPSFAFFRLFLGISLLSLAFLAMCFAKGMDGVTEGIEYLLVVVHLGMGFMFFVYVLINFFTPLQKGLNVYRILYKPQSFHYATATLGGMVVALALFLLPSQISYKMFKSVSYCFLGDLEQSKGNNELAITYYKYANFLGYNTHYPNYQMGTLYQMKNDSKLAAKYFKNATMRNPSPQSLINASTTVFDHNPVLAKGLLKQGLVHFPNQPEILNNLGLVEYQNQQREKAHTYFSSAQSTQNWNNALDANKWATILNLSQYDSMTTAQKFEESHPTVKINTLAASLHFGKPLAFTFEPSDLAISNIPLHRQAYLLNASLLKTDTSFHRLLKKEIETTQNTKMRDALTKALIVNTYKAGKITSALDLMDQWYLSKDGKMAGQILDEMGIFLLDQHAPREAARFFVKAIEKGYLKSKPHLLVAFLESNQWEKAYHLYQNLVQSDTENPDFFRALGVLFLQNSDNAQPHFITTYYQAQNLSPKELKKILIHFSQKEQYLILQKRSEDLENQGKNPQPYLDVGLTFPQKMMPYGDTTTLLKIAEERPFNENMVTKASQILEKTDVVKAYNLLTKCLNYNPFSLPLLKRHANLSILINMPEYANPSLEKLEKLMEKSAFSKFIAEWNDLKQRKELENITKWNTYE